MSGFLVMNVLFMIQFVSGWMSLYTSNLVLLASSGSFFSFWVLLELNLVLFVGLVLLSGKSGRPAVKYLVVQGLASATILVTVLASMAFGAQTLAPSLLAVSVFLKLGVAPFQEWFISLGGTLSWSVFFLLSTAQKLPALMLFSWFFHKEMLLGALLLSSAVTVSGTSGAPSIRAVLGFSAVVNSSWLLTSVKLQGVFFYVFLLYVLAVYLVMSSFFGSSGSGESLLARGASASGLIGTLSGLLMLAGVPPFLGAVYKFALVSILAGGYGGGGLGLFVSVSVWLLYIYLSQGLSLLMTQGSRVSKLNGTELGGASKALILLLPVVLWKG